MAAAVTSCPRTIAKLAPAMDAAAARATVRRALELISQATTPPAAHAALAQVVADLAPRMDWDGDGARAAVKSLLQVLHDEPDDLARAGVAHTVAELARHMNADGTREATPLLVQALSQQSNPLARAGLARAIAALAPRIDDAAAREAVALLLQLIKKEVDATARNQLAQSVAALAGHLDTAQAAKVCRRSRCAGISGHQLGGQQDAPLRPDGDDGDGCRSRPASGCRQRAAQPPSRCSRPSTRRIRMASATWHWPGRFFPWSSPQMDGATGREVTTALLQAIPKEKNDLARIATGPGGRRSRSADGRCPNHSGLHRSCRRPAPDPPQESQRDGPLPANAGRNRPGPPHGLRPGGKVRTQVTPLLLQAPATTPLGSSAFS